MRRSRACSCARSCPRRSPGTPRKTLSPRASIMPSWIGRVPGGGSGWAVWRCGCGRWAVPGRHTRSRCTTRERSGCMPCVGAGASWPAGTWSSHPCARNYPPHSKRRCGMVRRCRSSTPTSRCGIGPRFTSSASAPSRPQAASTTPSACTNRSVSGPIAMRARPRLPCCSDWCARPASPACRRANSIGSAVESC